MNVKRCSIIEQLRDTWKVMFTIIIIVMALVIVSSSFKKSDASTGLLIGFITGVAVHWILYAKAFILTDRALVSSAKSWVTGHGYVTSKNENEFVPNVHWLLRFKSQNIRFLRVSDSKTKIVGPFSILKKLEKIIILQ